MARGFHRLDGVAAAPGGGDGAAEGGSLRLKSGLFSGTAIE
jgi:hypothetical protein